MSRAGLTECAWIMFLSGWTGCWRGPGGIYVIMVIYIDYFYFEPARLRHEAAWCAACADATWEVGV
jgi:hypothetical protein